MNELIENTLNIISKISSSRQGYLLQLGENGHSVLNIWGARADDFTTLNDHLLKLFKAGGIDTEKIGSFLSIKSFLKQRFVASFFIKDLIYFSESNLYVYILLFSDNVKEFKEDSKNRITPILSILSHQVKQWYEQRVEKKLFQSDLASTAIERKKIFNEWEEKFNLLATTSPDLIFILDISGKIILINENSKTFLEYSPDEMRNKYFLDFIAKENQTAVNNSLSKILAEKKVVKFGANVVTKYGQVLPVEFSCNSITENKKNIGLLGIGKDLTEKFRYENELQKLRPKLIEINRLLNIERARISPQKSVVEELNRLKLEFISGISHEFRTTLASIIGFSESIVSDPDITEEMKDEFINVIMSEGKRLAKLINYFLDTSTREEGMLMINKTSFELIGLIQAVIDANMELANSKNIVINFEHPQEEIYLEADKESIYQVVNALLNNGIRYTDEFGRVKLILNNYISDVEIIVSDTGIGIPDEDQPYIFQRFYKASRGMSDVPSVGVGLVFVKQIIDLHKGLISVQSETGSGTTFLVKLPKRSKIEKNEVKFE